MKICTRWGPFFAKSQREIKHNHENEKLGKTLANISPVHNFERGRWRIALQMMKQKKRVMDSIILLTTKGNFCCSLGNMETRAINARVGKFTFRLNARLISLRSKKHSGENIQTTTRLTEIGLLSCELRGNYYNWNWIIIFNLKLFLCNWINIFRLFISWNCQEKASW